MYARVARQPAELTSFVFLSAGSLGFLKMMSERPRILGLGMTGLSSYFPVLHRRAQEQSMDGPVHLITRSVEVVPNPSSRLHSRSLLL